MFRANLSQAKAQVVILCVFVLSLFHGLVFQSRLYRISKGPIGEGYPANVSLVSRLDRDIHVTLNRRRRVTSSRPVPCAVCTSHLPHSDVSGASSASTLIGQADLGGLSGARAWRNGGQSGAGGRSTGQERIK